ncbi:citrate lyase subunit alpha, partial [Salmonella enterica]|uniref:citrate lyase subunit alpha n=1 Tax=Salmonella enterica TaxID=28901 RepID=UPI0032984133
GASVAVLVPAHGIAVNPARQDLLDILRAAGVALTTIEQLHQRAEQLTATPQPRESTDRVVAVVRARDGSESDG